VFYFLSFFFGASIGSFVNVIITRLHVAKIATGRSKCLSCGEKIHSYDLIPILSYLVLWGKCRHCKTSYGISSLVIEMLYGIVFVSLYHFILTGQATTIGFILWLTYYTLFFIVLGVIALYDAKHTYIPILYLLLYAALTLVVLGLRYQATPSYIVLLGPFTLALPFLSLFLLTRGKGLGFGDVLLFAGVGAFFSVEQGFAVLLISVWLGALYGVVVLLKRRAVKNTSTMIPFVPFIVLAFLIVLFTDIDIFSIASLFA
jgi:leader peptidase (prepilin peptidase)/N-methyltransferase